MLKNRGLRGLVIFVMVFSVALLTVLVLLFQPGSTRLTIDTRYQAVMLTNGQVLYGRLDNASSRFPSLTDVYYIQSQTNQETQKITSVLVRRGKEWHSPDRTVLNADNILLIEPVKPDSPLAKRIAELNEK